MTEIPRNSREETILSPLADFSYRCLFGNFTDELYVGASLMVSRGETLAETAETLLGEERSSVCCSALHSRTRKEKSNYTYPDDADKRHRWEEGCGEGMSWLLLL